MRKLATGVIDCRALISQQVKAANTVQGRVRNLARVKRATLQYRWIPRFQFPWYSSVCDIDHFKHVNDTCGHAAGDLVIQGLAKELTRIVGTLGHAERFGGEEFVAFLPNSSIGQAIALADTVRTCFAIKDWSKIGVSHEVTLSCGVSAVAPKMLVGTGLDLGAWNPPHSRSLCQRAPHSRYNRQRGMKEAC